MLKQDLNQTRLLTADILIQQGQPQHALKHYKLISQPDTVIQTKIFVAEATLNFQDGNYEKVKQQCEERLKENPEDMLTLHYVSSAYLKLEHVKAAEKVLQTIVSANPENIHLYIDAHDKLALLALRKGFTGQAKQRYMQVAAHIEKNKNKLSNDHVYQELSVKNSEKLTQLNKNIVQVHQQTAAHVVTQCVSGLLHYFLKPPRGHREPDLIPAYPTPEPDPVNTVIKQSHTMRQHTQKTLIKKQSDAHNQARNIKFFPSKQQPNRNKSASAQHAAETKAFLATL